MDLRLITKYLQYKDERLKTKLFDCLWRLYNTKIDVGTYPTTSYKRKTKCEEKCLPGCKIDQYRLLILKWINEALDDADPI